ncbi:MAG: ribbon-helix-helix domain-containing protein [bacterium]
MITYNISLNKELAQLVDEQIEFGKFANRSEFFRQLLRNTFLSKDEDWIYNEPHYGELQKRVKNLDGQKLTSAKEFDKEFKF